MNNYRFITEDEYIYTGNDSPLFQSGICFIVEAENDTYKIYKVTEGKLLFNRRYAVKSKIKVQLMKFKFDKTELFPIDGMIEKQYMTYKVFNLVEDTQVLPISWNSQDISIYQLLRQDKINIMKRIFITKNIKLHDKKPDCPLFYDYDDLENIILYNQKIALVYDKRRN